MKIYISGKIGEEEFLSEETRQKFAQAEARMRMLGYDVFNPTTSGLGERAEELAKVNGTDFYTEIMNLDLAELAWCDAIYMLTDWTDSPGAKREYAEASKLGLAIWYEDNKEVYGELQ